MTRYLISFPDGAMTFPDEDLPAVDAAAHAVVAEAKAAGVWVTGAGIDGHEASVVGTDGEVRDVPYPGGCAHIGGFCIVEVGTRDEALAWGAKFAVACRCAQEVRPLMDDPEA